ncbi:hypothetical protein INR49_024208 [Caranx melampygus]|nr:hypothetical protein INR49_024208 [Caranx melampygus]
MYKNILPNLKNNAGVRSHFNTEAVDWVDKYFQIGSAYYFTQSDSEKQLDTEGGFICSFLGYLCLEIYCSYSGGQNSPHHTPSPISLSCVINIFFQYSQPKYSLMLFC